VKEHHLARRFDRLNCSPNLVVLTVGQGNVQICQDGYKGLPYIKLLSPPCGPVSVFSSSPPPPSRRDIPHSICRASFRRVPQTNLKTSYLPLSGGFKKHSGPICLPPTLRSQYSPESGSSFRSFPYIGIWSRGMWGRACT